MTNDHKCDPRFGTPGSPVTVARVLRLLLAYLDDDDFEGNAQTVIDEIAGCAQCWFGAAMGSVGMSVSFMRELQRVRGEDPRPSLEHHLAAALDQIAQQESEE